jgi:hypothetical protein
MNLIDFTFHGFIYCGIRDDYEPEPYHLVVKLKRWEIGVSKDFIDIFNERVIYSKYTLNPQSELDRLVQLMSKEG